MGRSLQLLAQVGSPQFAKCVSLPSLFSSSSAPLLWMPTSTRKSARSNVVVSLKDSAHSTGPAMRAMTDSTTAHAELTTTTREKQRLTPLLWLNLSLWLKLMLTLFMVTMGQVWDIPMEAAWGTPMDIALATTVIPQAMLKASMGMDLDMDTAMVWVTSINQLFSIQNCVTGAYDKINIQILKK